MHIFNYYPYR